MAQNKLPKAETYFYFLSWIFAIIYSQYHVFLAGDRLVTSIPEEYFSDGWSFINREKDDLDVEWNQWMTLIQYKLPLWIILHYVISQIIRKFLLKFCILPLWYFFITSLCVISIIPAKLYALLVIQPIIFFLCTWIDYKPLVWITSCSVLTIITYLEHIWDMYEYFDEDELMLLMVTILWQHLKCISFSLDDVKNKITIESFLHFIGYSFYLPTFFFGPIMLYEDFLPSMKRNPDFKMAPGLLHLLLNNIRYLFWLYFTEFTLHYIYVNILVHYIDIFENKSIWLMYGLGCGMGLFFFLKYTVAYGLSTTWTRAEGYRTPAPPKCVLHINLYSDLWRSFDEGFHWFIKKYIYLPYLKNIMQTSLWHRIKVSFGCFAFICVWHGLFRNVFVWSCLNFIILVIQTLGTKFGRSNMYSRWRVIMGRENERRIKGFVCVPVTMVSGISNFYFLGGVNVGNAYFSYLLNSSGIDLLCSLYFSYAFYQVSLEFKSYPDKFN